MVCLGRARGVGSIRRHGLSASDKAKTTSPCGLVAFAWHNGRRCFWLAIAQYPALQWVSSSHSAVINGILPLATAVIGASLNREHLPAAFWVCAAVGTCLVCGYAWVHASGALHTPDALLLLGVLLGGLGYACGAIATKYISGPEVISWALLMGLPVTLPYMLYVSPVSLAAVPLTGWLAFVYLGLMSQWIGFFFWYRGLLMGGIAKVSQVQLLQLFLTLGFSALLLGESIEPMMLFVAVATVALIVVGRRAKGGR